MIYLNIFFKYLWLPFLVTTLLALFKLKYDLIGITFILLTAQCIIFLVYFFKKFKSVNLIIIFYIFNLIFLIIVPWIHYSNGVYIWRSGIISEITYIKTNLLIFLSNFIVFLIYLISFNKKNIKLKMRVAPIRKKTTNFFLIALSSLSFLLLLYLNNFSLIQLLFRGVVDEIRHTTIESSSLSLLLTTTSRLIPVFCFLYAATQLKNSKPTKFLLFAILFVSVFPTGIARYMVAFVYIPIILIYIPQLRSPSLFSAILIGSVLFIFPFLNQFRHFSGFENISIFPSIDFFYAAHFDAYENFASAIESDFITYGYQLLGSIFFFIPRVFWLTKPVGSGYEMAEHLGYYFNNISMPFLGEGFVNFGTLGILIFSLLFGYISAKTDFKFAKSSTQSSRSDFSLSIYYYLIGSLFFILRGDLLSSTAYVSAGLFSAFFVRLIAG